MSLFPFDQFWWLYVAFTFLVSIVLVIDLGVFQKEAHVPSFKEASLWTLAWVLLAALTNIALYLYVLKSFSLGGENFSPDFLAESMASKYGMEFLTGYLVEKTLAIDNIFVFAMVFSYFNVKPKYQHKVLFWGIIGAVFFRAIFIALGSYLMKYEALVAIFGVFLILTGLKMAFHTSSDNLEDKWILKFLKKILPLMPDNGQGDFFIRHEGKLFFTPLFLALGVIEFSDIIFAIDSVPAIFAITDEPFIVFTSNIMAILGLRSMYFMLVGFMDKFAYIKYGLAAVLVFVGLKMSWLNHAFGGKFPITWSLMIIIGLVSASIIASLVKNKRKDSL